MGSCWFPHVYWAGLVLLAVNQYCAHSFARNWQLPFLNQWKGENDRRKYFMISLRERMLPTSVGVESATSWSPVGWRIQLSHWGWLIYIFRCYCGEKEGLPRYSSLTTQFHVLDTVTKAIAPIIPHMAEELYFHYPKSRRKPGWTIFCLLLGDLQHQKTFVSFCFVFIWALHHFQQSFSHIMTSGSGKELSAHF